MKCKSIDFQAGSDGHGFIPVEVHCENKATAVTEDGCHVCDACAKLFRAQGFVVTPLVQIVARQSVKLDKIRPLAIEVHDEAGQAGLCGWSGDGEAWRPAELHTQRSLPIICPGCMIIAVLDGKERACAQVGCKGVCGCENCFLDGE